MKTLGKRREKVGQVASLLLQGVKSLALAEPEERICGKCKLSFQATWAGQWVCRTCVETGRLMPAEELRAKRAEERRRRLAAAGLTGNLLQMTFERFLAKADPIAHGAARYFCEHWEEGNLVLIGVVGSGKTHLAAAIAHELSEQGVDVRYVHIPTLGYELRSAGSGDAWAKVAQARINPLRDCDVAILDDLGREKRSDAWAEALDSLIDYRVNLHAPIVVTANLTSNELASYEGGAVVSRLLSSANPVETVAVDRRVEPVYVPPVREEERDPREQCKACDGAGWVIDGRLSVSHPDRLMKCPACNGRGW